MPKSSPTRSSKMTMEEMKNEVEAKYAVVAPMEAKVKADMERIVKNILLPFGNAAIEVEIPLHLPH